MPKTLIEELPRIAAEGRREAQQVLDRLAERHRQLPRIHVPPPRAHARTPLRPWQHLRPHRLARGTLYENHSG